MEELRRKQIMLTEMLAFFHEYCVAHNLRYCALGGTVLGAVRHRGFIPWDDDIDVALPRADYEKLISSFNEINTNRMYCLESPYTDEPHYCYPFSKIYNKNTTLIENVRNPIKRGVYIDIFPLDGAGNSLSEAKKYYKKTDRINFYRILCMNNAKSSNVLNYALKKGYQGLLHFFRIYERDFAQHADRISKIISYDDSKYIGNYSGAYHIKECMPKEYIGSPKLVNFENIQIYCPEQTEKYLECLYGQWQCLPPEDKRIPHHDNFCDLDHPYSRD